MAYTHIRARADWIKPKMEIVVDDVGALNTSSLFIVIGDVARTKNRLAAYNYLFRMFDYIRDHNILVSHRLTGFYLETNVTTGTVRLMPAATDWVAADVLPEDVVFQIGSGSGVIREGLTLEMDVVARRMVERMIEETKAS